MMFYIQDYVNNTETFRKGCCAVGTGIAYTAKQELSWDEIRESKAYVKFYFRKWNVITVVPVDS